MNKFNINQVVHRYVYVCMEMKFLFKVSMESKAILKKNKPKRLKLVGNQVCHKTVLIKIC